MEISPEYERRAKQALFELVNLYRDIGLADFKHTEYHTLFDMLHICKSEEDTAVFWKKDIEQTREYYWQGFKKLNTATEYLFEALDLLPTRVITPRQAIDRVKRIHFVNEKRYIPIDPETSIEDLDLRYHTVRILKWLKVKTYAELKTIKKEQLKAVRSCGFATVRDVKAELRRHGVELH
jgi:hypothetical protein